MATATCDKYFFVSFAAAFCSVCLLDEEVPREFIEVDGDRRARLLVFSRKRASDERQLAVFNDRFVSLLRS